METTSRFSALFTLVALFCAAFTLNAEILGGDHTIFGKAFNSDGTIPKVTFKAYVTTRPGEILTEKSAECGYGTYSPYGSNIWWVQTGNFPTSWTTGEVLQCDLTNEYGQTESTTKIITTVGSSWAPNVTFNVSVPAPIADFSAAPTTGTAPLTVKFTDSSTGSISNWKWSFGDGATTTQDNPTHIFTTPGVYSVTLTVTGPGGTGSITMQDLIHVVGDDAVTILSPSTERYLYAGMTYKISWNSVLSNDEKVSITFLTTSGKSIQILSDGLNQNEFAWYIPTEIIGDSGKINLQIGGAEKLTDSTFTIKDPINIKAKLDLQHSVNCQIIDEPNISFYLLAFADLYDAKVSVYINQQLIYYDIINGDQNNDGFIDDMSTFWSKQGYLKLLWTPQTPKDIAYIQVYLESAKNYLFERTCIYEAELITKRFKAAGRENYYSLRDGFCISNDETPDDLAAAGLLNVSCNPVKTLPIGLDIAIIEALIGINENWGGRCLGLSSASINLYRYPELKPINKDNIDFKWHEIADIILQEQTSQNLYLFNFKDHFSTFKDLYDEIENDLQEPCILGISWGWRSKHAVSIFYYTHLREKNPAGMSDERIIWTYDPNTDENIYAVPYKLLDDTDFIGPYIDKITKVPTLLDPYPILNYDKCEFSSWLVKTHLQKRDSHLIYSACPVNILIEDPDGAQIGQKEDGTLINEINDAFYYKSNLGEDSLKLFFLPNGKDYTVHVFGNSTGTMALGKVRSSEDSLRHDHFSQVSINADTRATCISSQVGLSPLAVDQNNDGTFETFYNPNEDKWSVVEEKANDLENDPNQDSEKVEIGFITPNPFIENRGKNNNQITIPINIAKNLTGHVEIYDLLGRTVFTQDLGALGRKSHSILWDTRDLKGVRVSSGTYIVRLVTARAVKHRLLTIIR